MLSDAIGATGEDIMFSSNDTPAEEFVLADKLNAIINLDDITHIDFLEKAIGHIPDYQLSLQSGRNVQDQ